MSRRYVTLHRRANDEWWDEADACDSLAKTVYERDAEPRPTGLLDKQGNELFCIDEMDPVGFVRMNGQR